MNGKPVFFEIECCDGYGYTLRLDHYRSERERDLALAKLRKDHPFCTFTPHTYFPL